MVEYENIDLPRCERKCIFNGVEQDFGTESCPIESQIKEEICRKEICCDQGYNANYTTKQCENYNECNDRHGS